MLSIPAVLRVLPGLDEADVIDWVARGWVRVEGATPAQWEFTELDVTRLHLVRELRVELALDVDTLAVVLSLLDQVYSLRRTLDGVIEAVGDAPDDIKRRVLAALASR